MSDLDDGYDPPHRNPLTPAGPHSPADDVEEVYYEGSPLLRGEPLLLFLSFLAALTLTCIAAAIIYNYGLVFEVPIFVALGLIVVAFLVLVFPALWVRRHRYKITNYRIDFEHGLVTTNIDTLELWHVNDIRFRQSLWDRMFRVGTIYITSDDRSTPELLLRSLPTPRPLFEQLKQRVISVKRQRGVIKMDTGGS